MPDITKCTNDECSLKETCYRWTSIPSEYSQAFVKYETIMDEQMERCDYYIDIDTRKLNTKKVNYAKARTINR